jgi:hypothetical protein
MPPRPSRSRYCSTATEADRLLPPVAADLPLVEAVGDDQASPAADESAVGALLEQRLGPGVDHLVGDPSVLRPVGDESPAQERRLARAVLASAYREHALARRDVVALRDRFRNGDLEPFGERLAPHGAREATTHGAENGRDVPGRHGFRGSSELTWRRAHRLADGARDRRRHRRAARDLARTGFGARRSV